MRARHLVSMAWLLAFVSACSNSEGDSRCFRICERANGCGLAERAVDVECDRYCADVEQMQRRMEGAGFSSCEMEYDQHLSCWVENLGQICNPDLCADTGTTWTECMRPFCAANKAAVDEHLEGAIPDPNCDDEAPAPALAPF